MRGLPLRDLLLSPALGASQLRVVGVLEKARWCDGLSARVLSAVLRPELVVSQQLNRRAGAVLLRTACFGGDGGQERG